MIVESQGTKVPVRRSLLWVAGTRLETLANVAHHKGFGADVVTLDLEDTVPPLHKATARHSVTEALRTLAFGRAECSVRVNGPGPVGRAWFEDDIAAVVPAQPAFIRLPKITEISEVELTDRLITEAEVAAGLEVGVVKIVLNIEHPQAVRRAYDMATISERVIGLVMSGEDYTESIRAHRSTRPPEYEMLYARGKLLVDARAAGIDAYDSVFMDLDDIEGFREEATLARQIGFDGKNCLSPEQVAVANEVFGPTAAEVAFSRKAVAAFDAIGAVAPSDDGGAGTGVLPIVDGTLIGPPVALKARRVVAIADALRLG